MEKWIETLSTFGLATGLYPELLFAGAAGGWLALTYQEPTAFLVRSRRVVLSALAATWCTPLAIHLLGLPSEPPIAKFPLALAFGLLTMDVLGKGVISLARKWFREKSND